MKQIVISLSFLAVFFVGCAQPRIDTSSDESTKRSIEDVRQSLSHEKQTKFDEAIKVIMFRYINIGGMLTGAFTGNLPKQENMIDDVKTFLNGKTASEVISEANRIKEETR